MHSVTSCFYLSSYPSVSQLHENYTFPDFFFLFFSNRREQRQKTPQVSLSTSDTNKQTTLPPPNTATNLKLSLLPSAQQKRSTGIFSLSPSVSLPQKLPRCLHPPTNTNSSLTTNIPRSRSISTTANQPPTIHSSGTCFNPPPPQTPTPCMFLCPRQIPCMFIRMQAVYTPPSLLPFFPP